MLHSASSPTLRWAGFQRRMPVISKSRKQWDDFCLPLVSEITQTPKGTMNKKREACSSGRSGSHRDSKAAVWTGLKGPLTVLTWWEQAAGVLRTFRLHGLILASPAQGGGHHLLAEDPETSHLSLPGKVRVQQWSHVTTAQGNPHEDPMQRETRSRRPSAGY